MSDVTISEYTGNMFQVIGFFNQKVANVSDVTPAELDGSTCWLAEVDGEPAGMAVVDGGLLRRIGVADDFRRSGVGQELVRHAVAEHGQLRARVQPEKAGAKQFYETLGWELVDDEGNLHVYESR